jgi:hypothetical protein
MNSNISLLSIYSGAFGFPKQELSQASKQFWFCLSLGLDEKERGE